MADQIANVVQRGTTLYVTDAKGKQLCIINHVSNGEFRGFTASTISVQRRDTIFTYDSTGKQLSITPAR
ncbi:hypothetical protein AGMMS50229_16370 [Campylobacterota bacterium]|nr:hypothetical protein AGMMS50229_16370 [Campylobacterota bacterium]